MSNLTGEDLGYRPSVLEQTKFDHSLLGKVFNKGLDDKDDKNQNVNNNDRNKKTNDESELSSVKCESSKKTLTSDKLEGSVYYPDVANMEGIDILEPKDEIQPSYLEDDLEVFFLGYPGIFDSDLEHFFENIVS